MPYDIGSFIGMPSATVGGGTTAQSYTDPLTNISYYLGTPSFDAYLKRIGGALPGTFGAGATPVARSTGFGNVSFSTSPVATPYTPYTTLPTAANPTVTLPAAPGRITPTAAPTAGTPSAAPSTITPTAMIPGGTATPAIPGWTPPSEPSWMADLRAAQQNLQGQTSGYQAQLNALLQQNQALQAQQAANTQPAWMTQLLQAQQKAQDDAANWQAKLAQINAANVIAQQQANASRIPGALALEDQSSRNIQQQLSGQVPQDVVALLQGRSAEQGIGRGIAGSPATNAAYMRALGLTSIGQQQAGQEALSAAYARNPSAPIYDPTNLMLTPYQSSQIATNIAGLLADYENNKYSLSQKDRELAANLTKMGMDATTAAYALQQGDRNLLADWEAKMQSLSQAERERLQQYGLSKDQLAAQERSRLQQYGLSTDQLRAQEAARLQQYGLAQDQLSQAERERLQRYGLTQDQIAAEENARLQQYGLSAAQIAANERQRLQQYGLSQDQIAAQERARAQEYALEQQRLAQNWAISQNELANRRYLGQLGAAGGRTNYYVNGNSQAAEKPTTPDYSSFYDPNAGGGNGTSTPTVRNTGYTPPDTYQNDWTYTSNYLPPWGDPFSAFIQPEPYNSNTYDTSYNPFDETSYYDPLKILWQLGDYGFGR